MTGGLLDGHDDNEESHQIGTQLPKAHAIKEADALKERTQFRRDFLAPALPSAQRPRRPRPLGECARSPNGALTLAGAWR